MAQISDHKRHGAGAIHVIVSKQPDGFVVDNGAGQALGQCVHAGQRRRVGHQRANGRCNKGLGVLDRDTARGDDAGKNFREVGLLGDGARHAAGRKVEPIDPALATDRSFNVEKGLGLWLHGVSIDGDAV